MDKEKQIVEISKQILKDFGREYFGDTFDLRSPQDLKSRGNYEYSYDVWKLYVDVPDEQFGGQSPFSIYFKDETMEPFMFHDGGAEGRTPYLKIIKKNGKYEIGDEWKNE